MGKIKKIYSKVKLILKKGRVISVFITIALIAIIIIAYENIKNNESKGLGREQETKIYSDEAEKKQVNEDMLASKLENREITDKDIENFVLDGSITEEQSIEINKRVEEQEKLSDKVIEPSESVANSKPIEVEKAASESKPTEGNKPEVESKPISNDYVGFNYDLSDGFQSGYIGGDNDYINRYKEVSDKSTVNSFKPEINKILWALADGAYEDKVRSKVIGKIYEKKYKIVDLLIQKIEIENGGYEEFVEQGYANTTGNLFTVGVGHNILVSGNPNNCRYFKVIAIFEQV